MPFNPLAQLLKDHPKIDPKKVQEAYDLAKSVHEGQTRLSGEAYIHHPVAVAGIMVKAGGDTDTICAALLHDSIEDAIDSKKTADTIRQKFGERTYFLVEAVSKDQEITDSKVRHQVFIEQLDAAFNTDAGVFFIKWADLIHNLESIELLKPEKKDKWLSELQNDYLPVLSDYFHRLSFHYHPVYHSMMDQFEDIVAAKL